jgi:uncharacterized linocin/CFP29 family protein
MKVEGFINGQAVGSIAQRLMANGMKVNGLRTHATLLKDEWKQVDGAVIKAAQQRLVGIADLKRRGLVYSFPGGLGKTVLQYQDMGNVTGAQINMTGTTRGNNDRPEFDLKYFPLPIISADFQLSTRELEASRNGSMPLDVTMPEMKARAIAEMQEEILFQGGNAFAFGGGVLYGYVDAPNRNLGTLCGAWDASGVTGEDIVADVLRMKQASIADRQYGPWVLYIPQAYETKMDEDYNAVGTSGNAKTIRERLLAIQGIEEVKVSDKLIAIGGKENVLLVQMRQETARMVTGLPLTTVEWNEMGGLVFNFKIMTIDVPQIRADQDGRSGIIHFQEPDGLGGLVM